MAGIREVLQFLIEADASNAIRTFDNVEKASARSLGAAEKSSTRFGATLTKAGAATVAAAATAGVGLYKLGNQASNLELSQRRLQNIFGDSGSAMVDFAKGLNDIGLSDQQATAAIASIGEAARGLGLSAEQATKLTPQLVKIVTQLGYLQGLSPGEALETVNAAMRGEYDSLQRLVPSINQAVINQRAMRDSGKDNAQQLTAQEKTMAALNLIVENGGKTLGRAGDVMDTLAGRAAVTKANMADLGTAIGAGALPVIQELSTWVGNAAGAFNSMPTGVQTATGRIAAFTVVGATALGTISLIAGQLIKMKEQWDRFATAKPLTASIVGNVAGIVTFAAGLEAVAAGIEAADKAAQKAKINEIVTSKGTAQIKAFNDAVDNAGRNSGRVAGILPRLTHNALDPLGDAAVKASDKVKVSEKVFRDLVETEGVGIGAGQRYIDMLKKRGENTGNYQKILDQQVRAQRDANQAAKDTQAILDGTATSGKKAADATQSQADATGAAAASTQAFDDALKTANDNADVWTGMLDLGAKQADAFASAIERTSAADDQIAAGLNIGKASADFAETAKDLPGTIDQMKLALGGYNEAQTTAISNLMSLSDQTSAYLSTLISSGATTDQVKTQANNLALAYAQQMQAAGLTEDQINEYLKVLGLTPDQVNTAITVSGTEAARQKLTLLQTQIDELPKDVQTKVTQQIIAGDYQGALATINSYYANNPATLPVKVVLQSQSVERAQRFGYSSPTTPGRNVPLGRSAGLRAAPGYVPQGSVINVYMPQGASGQSVVAALRKYEKRNGTTTAGWHPL